MPAAHPAAAPAFSPPCPSLQKYVPLDLRSKKTRAIRRRLTKAQVRAQPLLVLIWVLSCPCGEGRQSPTELKRALGAGSSVSCALDAGWSVQLSGVATADTLFSLSSRSSTLPGLLPIAVLLMPIPTPLLRSPCRPTPRPRRLPRRRAPSRCGSTRSRHEDLGGSTLQPCRHTR